ncbi:uncharacterized protein LOC131041421 [Cryptomeria japonica]|uniref:uncharacterized protein LOC131041421 n=1 Tax=Cryptomeria japonica TaxID=3369 RepID=UPI0027DA19CD|nr:uncharacterized protein LOC131041421 [Cryptomeria japonica]
MDFSVPKRLCRKGFRSVVKYVTMMMRKRASMKRLDYQFSFTTTTPLKWQISTATSKWASLRSLVLGCTQRWENRTLSLSLSFPRFSIENAPSHYSSESDHDHTNKDKKVEVDREAEDFIAKFYKEMELQRQDSFLKWQEMLGRGT